MKFRKKIIRFVLLASVFSMPVFAQTTTQPVIGLTVNQKLVGQGQQNPVVATVSANAPTQQPASINVPKSLQSGQEVKQLPAPIEYVDSARAISRSASPEVLDVKPNMVSPDQILKPASMNKSQDFAQKEFKQSFDNAVIAGGVTMEKLLSDAYEKDPSINATRAGLKTVDEQLNQAYSGYLPNINYTINSNREKTNFDDGPSQITTPQSNSLSLRQGLFGGGETFYNVKSAEARVLAAQNELRSAEQEFLSKAIKSYIEYIYTQKVLKLARNNEEVLKEQLRSSKERFVVGDATKTDVAQSEARLANATSNKVIAIGDFISAKANFKKFFDMDAPKKLPMPANLPNIPTTLEQAIKIALDNNPDVNQAKYVNKSRSYDVDVRRSQLLPQLDLTSSIDHTESTLSSGILSRDSQEIGLALTVPIYTQGGINYSRTREARDRKDQAQQQYADTIDSTRSSVVQAWQKVETTRSNIEATKSSLVASEFALEGVREEQKEGTRTVLDVLDAEQEKFVAETAHARAIKDSVLAIYDFKLILGELTPSELGLSVKEYDPSVHNKNTRFKIIGL